jgi:hypothetical protein
MKSPLQTHGLKAWFPAGGVVLEDAGNFSWRKKVTGGMNLEAKSYSGPF